MKNTQSEFNLKFIKINYKKDKNKKINYEEFQKFLLKYKLNQIYNKKFGCFRIAPKKINEYSIQEKIEKKFEQNQILKRFIVFKNDINMNKKNKFNLILPEFNLNKRNLIKINLKKENNNNNNNNNNFLLSRNLSFLYNKKNNLKTNLKLIKYNSEKNLLKKNSLTFYKNKNINENEEQCEKINIYKNLYNKYNFIGEQKPFFITKLQKLFTKKIIINKKSSTLCRDLIYKKINKSIELEK